MPIIKYPYDTVCPVCGKTTTHEITEDQYTMLTQPRHLRPKMQDIFPDMDRDEREEFISGICKDCWNANF
jgi:uncharacterized Zn finger protein (UPF0148 family)